MPGTLAIHQFLREARVPYTVVPHRPGFAAQEESTAAHVPSRNRAKVVVCFVDGVPVQAVLPAPLTVNLARLMVLARGSEIRLADESELTELFPGCERGALPPFGPLYGQPVFVDVHLASESDIIFSDGTHTEAICMRWAEYAAIARPIVGLFAEQVYDHVGAFRLSYRE
jgi:Ala-tRNA(Pro) deacylase